MGRERDVGGHRVSFHVLGPLRVVVDDSEVPIASRRQRALLVLLLVNVGRVVPSERLIDQLWDGAPPPQGAVTLRSYVSNLRQALGGSSGVGAALVTRGHGYCLDVPAESLDALRLDRQAQDGREHLRLGRPEAALAAFEEALRAWGGDPLADIADHEAARSTVARLTETYLGALEGRFASLLALGRHTDALPGLEAFVDDHPLREEPRALLMTALYRAGRTPEALEVHRNYRNLLGDELGLDPSGALDELQQRILEQDPILAPAPYQPRARMASAPADEQQHGPKAPPPESAGPVTQAPGPVIFGRKYELSVIEEHIDALVVSGTGALLLVAGEPGIGKTTLVEALEERARGLGCAVHSGRSPAAGGAAPAFWPWLQVIDSVAADLDDDTLRLSCAGAAAPVSHLSAAVAERTGQASPVHGDDPRTVRFLLYEAVSVFLHHAMRGRPLVITLDDIHWADLPSLELLSYLTPSLATQPMLVVAAYRDLPAERAEDLDATLATVSREDVVHELPLTGLGPADVADLMHLLLSGTSSTSSREPLFSRLHERTAGNPFFVRQLARLIVEGEENGTDPSSVPPGVRHVIARRLAVLPDTVQTFLAAAAVVGREFDLRIAATTAGMNVADALDAFDEATRHGLVEDRPVNGPDRRFVHALVQEVVLEALPSGRAARLHASLAAQLEQDDTVSADELARHTWAARDILGTEAVPSLVAAAEAAAAVYSLEQAEVHLRRALELIRLDPSHDPSTELSLLLRLFRIIMTGRGWGDAEARSVIERAMRLAESGAYGDDTARLWWSMAFFLLDRNDESYVDVADVLLAASEEAAPPDGATPEPDGPASPIGHASRVVAHLTGIFSALHAGDRATALTHLRTARRHAEAAPAVDLAAFDEHLHVMLLLIEGYWAAFTGDQATHRSTTDASIALADADGRPFPRAVARTLAAASGVYVADPAYVHALAADALRLDERFGFGWLAALATCVHGWADAHLHGATTRARTVIEAQLADVVAQGRRGNESILSIMLADVCRLEGRVGEARQILLRARDNPDSYRGLTVDLVDERLRRLTQPL